MIEHINKKYDLKIDYRCEGIPRNDGNMVEHKAWLKTKLDQIGIVHLYNTYNNANKKRNDYQAYDSHFFKKLKLDRISRPNDY